MAVATFLLNQIFFASITHERRLPGPFRIRMKFQFRIRNDTRAATKVDNKWYPNILVAVLTPGVEGDLLGADEVRGVVAV